MRLRSLLAGCLIVLAVISIAAPSSALAGGRYDVHICTSRTRAGDGVTYFQDQGSSNFISVSDGCEGFAPPSLNIAALSGMTTGAASWTLTAPSGTFIHKVEATRSFSPLSAWEAGMTWKVLSGAGPQVEIVNAAVLPTLPPSPSSTAWLVNSSTVTGTLYCPVAACNNTLSASARFTNVIATIEDEMGPTAQINLANTGPLRGAVQVPYVADDPEMGSGISGTQLQVDGKGVATAADSNGNKCELPFLVLAPCKPRIESSFSLDTTKFPDGKHTIAILAADASAQLGFSAVVPITIHNRPLNTRPPGISGTAKIDASLAGDVGGWEGNSASFGQQWLRCPASVTSAADAGSCTAIAGATGRNYLLTPDDVGLRNIFKVTSKNVFGSEVAFSEPSAVIAGDEPVRSGPPETAIRQRPPRTSRIRLAKVIFESNQAGSSFLCSLNGKPATPCSSPFKRTLKPGRHLFEVAAINAAGIADPTPAKARFQILKRR